SLTGKRHGHNGARAETAAGLRIHSRIRLSVIAADDPPSTEARPRKSRVRIQAHPRIRRDGAGRGTADDCVILGERDGNSVGPGNRQGAFGNQLQHFVENKLLQLPNVLGSLARTVLEGFALSDLLVERGKSEKRLQSLMSGRVSDRGSCCFAL